MLEVAVKTCRCKFWKRGKNQKLDLRKEETEGMKKKANTATRVEKRETFRRLCQYSAQKCENMPRPMASAEKSFFARHLLEKQHQHCTTLMTRNSCVPVQKEVHPIQHKSSSSLFRPQNLASKEG